MTDIDRANNIGLSYVTEWAPGGKQNGNEYTALNPTRSDSKLGSFSINTVTGKWGDFADNAFGGDPVSLYAYIFRSQLQGTTEGQIQVSAAKEILRIYNGEQPESFKPVKKETGYWSGYRQIQIPDDAPLIDYKFHEKVNGKLHKEWNFFYKNGKLAFKVARFIDSTGKKNDKPFTLWTNSNEIKWRSKALETKNPLYNLLGLNEFEELPVLLTEGQKNAEDSKLILQKHFVTTSLYGKQDKNDLEPLRGREVYIWVDPDGTGRAKASKLKKALLELDCRVYLVHSPSGKKKWDISDAIKENWTALDLVNHIKKEAGLMQPSEEEEYFLDDLDLPFKVLSITPEHIYIYSSRLKITSSYRSNALGKGSLLKLMPLREWEKFFIKADGKGVDWDAAADYILTQAESAPIHDSSLIRGAGLWRDTGGKLVCSTGEYLIVDGEKTGMMDIKSKFAYDRRPFKNYTYEDPMNIEESSDILKVFNHISFKSDLHRVFIMGWAFLAPFGGVLNWRPNIWLTGPSGSGKSTVQKIINNLINSFSEKLVANGSTEPGIRSALNNSALPVTLDEMESNDLNSKLAIQALLTMARQSSTGGIDSPKIVKGSSDGQGMSFRINSMFFFASVLADIQNVTDMDRIEVLELKDPKDTDFDKRENDFLELKKNVSEILTPDFTERFYSRALGIFEEVLIAIDVFVKCSAKILKSQRGGDQKGTLLAGCYMITHDKAPTEEQAIEWASQFDIQAAREENSIKPDYDTCMDIIMSYQIEGPGRKKLSIGLWVDEFEKEMGGGRDYDLCKDITPYLLSNGLKVKEIEGINYLGIATSHSTIEKILKDTPWTKTYNKLLRRHPDCSKVAGLVEKQRFGSSTKNTVWIRLTDECPI